MPLSDAERESAKPLPVLIRDLRHCVCNGWKTQTRRVVSPQPPSVESVMARTESEYHWMRCDELDPCAGDCTRIARVNWWIGRGEDGLDRSVVWQSAV
jgi:hypothetical protein